MNKIFKVIYSKTRHCYVVVSELAKNQGKSEKSKYGMKRHNRFYRLAAIAALIISVGSLLYPMQAEAITDLSTNDYFTAYDKNYFDKEGKKSEDWKNVKPSNTDQDEENVGAKGTGAIAAGIFAQAGQQTVTIGDRNAGMSMGSVFVGEYKGYNNPSGNQPQGLGNNYVTSVGFMSNATKYGTIAIGAGASAEGEDNSVTLGDKDPSGTLVSSLPDPENLKINGASVSLGYSAQSKHGNIAIGAYSDATTDLSADTSDKAKSYLTENNATSYVSVGSKDVQRRISNVADGAADSDVATVGQLKKLSDKAGVYNEGWGINIADENDPKTGAVTKKNVIILKHNLGTGYNDDEAKGMIIGGLVEDRDPAKQYGAADANSVIVGAGKALASGKSSVVVGGLDNVASGATSVVVGGDNNNAAGNQSAVFGGRDNTAAGIASTAGGGIMNVANGQQAVALGGAYNYALGVSSTAIGGMGGNGMYGYSTSVNGNYSVSLAGGSTGTGALNGLAAGNQSVVTTANGTAVGYQATTNKEGTIAFGHDAGDVSGYAVTWKQRTDGKTNADHTTNDYTQVPDSVTPTTYKDAYYNRLVKVADGQDDHDVVVMEQLKNAKNDLKVNAGWGIKVNDVTTQNDDGTETTTKNVISLNRNLGTNYGNLGWGEGKVTFEASGQNSLILGGAASVSEYDHHSDVKAGVYGKDSVLVGGFNNLIGEKGETSVIVGGRENQVTNQKSVIVGGFWNKVTGSTSVVVGGMSNEASGSGDGVFGGFRNKVSGGESVVLGGQTNEVTGMNSVVSGGTDNNVSGHYASANGGKKNTISGNYAATLGGFNNQSTGMFSNAIGGDNNITSGQYSITSGGSGNTASGDNSYIGGGGSNQAAGVGASVFGGYRSKVNGNLSTGVGGGSTNNRATAALAAGYQSMVTDGGVAYRSLTSEEKSKIYKGQQYWPGFSGFLVDNDTKVLDRISTAIGYQATADAPGVISFGHDKGDESSENGRYSSAYYNRLVKAADGIEDHDAVVMEQLKNASNVGQNIKVYKTDKNGNVQFDESNNPIEDTSDSDDVKTRREAAQKASEDAWGKAIGTGKIADPTKSDTNDPEANGSQQLVTGGTVYTEVRPATDGTYVKTKNTTAANLTALDKQVAANTTKLGDKNHNIKYYSVEDKISDDKLLPSISGYSNEKNDGAKGAGSMAAGFNTHADGIASTVAGSYSGVVGTGLQGAAALSYGTFNVNQNAAQAGTFSGVANSIVGQANVTTDSNAAIIYGAGNTVKNSYRDIDTKNASEISVAAGSGDVTKLGEALQKAVPTSGGQVMVMGGGNNVESAYMSQVVGVGNTVKGNQVKDDKKEWVSDTAIKKYDPEKSSQYNYVDGFNNEVINGKHDYVIGANNKLSGDSYDDKEAKKYSNESNIVFGDNHTLTNTKNAVIIGSSDTQMILDKGDNATAIGHNASAQRDALAVGVNTEARGNAVALGTSTIAHNNSIAIGTKATAVSSQNLAIGWEAHIGNIKTDDEKIKNAVALGSDSQVKVNDLLESDNNRGVLSIGDKDKERRIIHVRAGVNDTDAVNVSQLESAQSKLTDKGLIFAANEGKEHTAKLGSKVTIQGAAKREGHEYTADNLTTEIDENGNIKILMDKDMSVEKLAVNGKNGKDGAPGSIGINGRDGKSGIGIDGKDGISIKGRDGKDGVTMKAVDGENGTEGHIGLTGPAGTNGIKGADGQPGTSIDITVKNGYDGANGVNGKNGVDGTSLTRIVYKDGAGEHQVATMEDGLKFKGDDTTVINKKLNSTLDIIGGADSRNLTEGNIGVNSTKEGKLKVQLAKDLTDITSISNQTTTKDGDKDVTTGAKITLGADGTTTISGGDVNVSGNKITHVGSGIEKDANGKYTVTDQNKGNAANIGDVQNMVNDAKTELISGDNGLNNKANIDASNIGTNLKNADGSVASAEDQNANAEKWGKAIGTGKIEADNGQLVTGKTVYDEVRPTQDGSYVKKDKTTGENLSALDSKIGKLDDDGNYIKKDDSISKNLSTLDAQVKTNADNIANNTKSIQNITNSVKNLSDNAVQYDKDSNKTKVTLGGEGGTTITNVKDGALSEKSSDAVNGKQLYNEQKAREAADKDITKKVTNNTNEITKIKNGDFTDASKTAIHNIAKDAVKVVDGKNTTVTKVDGTDTTPTTYAVNVEGKGKVASGDTGLISGGTLYNEVHVTTDGSYIKSNNTVGQNLSALDSGLKTTSDLIHTNTAGDTIQIGGNSTATKIDVNGKDGKGRVITGVVTDASDPNSAANVGYVNGLTAANTQQIYRDMSNAYSRLDTNINRAAAGSNALAALHPLDFDPADKASFAVGYGHYRNANAAAVGAFYQPNANTMVNMGISLGNGDPGFNAGVSFKIGKGSAYNGVSKAEMAQTIHDQATEISAIKADDAAKDKRIDALEKENQEMKKQIQEILARLNG